MDDLSTLTPQAKYGVKFIDSVMTLFRQGILKLAWEICKKSNNFEENYRDSLQYAFLQRAKEVVEKKPEGIFNVCHFLKERLGKEELVEWEQEYATWR